MPSKNKNQIVWPTAKSMDPKQTFTTESFIAAVVKDLKHSHKIADARVFTLSWSSGGPAAYAASLADDTPIKGSFIAMSVFPIGQLQSSLPAAKGRRYYLLHSPDDKVCKYFFREVAAANLTKAGTVVETADYEGGHGWHGDVFGTIHKGMEWLDRPKSKTRAAEQRPFTRARAPCSSGRRRPSAPRGRRPSPRLSPSPGRRWRGLCSRSRRAP